MSSTRQSSNSWLEKVDILAERRHGKPVLQHVRDFAALFALIFLVIAGYLIYVAGSLTTILVLLAFATIFLIFGYLLPRLMVPVWQAWMIFAEFLGKIVTGIILSVLWIGLMIPTSLLLRVLAKKVMDLRCYDKNIQTYWEDRKESENDFQLLERQF